MAYALTETASPRDTQAARKHQGKFRVLHRCRFSRPELYLAGFGLGTPPSFDVVSVDCCPQGQQSRWLFRGRMRAGGFWDQQQDSGRAAGG